MACKKQMLNKKRPIFLSVNKGLIGFFDKRGGLHILNGCITMKWMSYSKETLNLSWPSFPSSYPIACYRIRVPFLQGYIRQRDQTVLDGMKCMREVYRS